VIALVANPDSGDGAAERVERALRAGGAEVEAFPPDRADDAAASGVARVAIAGGDGSIAPAASAAGKAGIPVAVIPTGTANDFAAAAGLPEDFDDACELALRGERTRAVDLAWLGERPFVNVASAGLAPQAARRAAGLKGALGSLAYLVGAIEAGARARPVRCRAECDGEPLFEGEAWQVTVGCSGAFGAGASVGGELGDGRLRVVAVPARARLSLLRRAYGLRRGRIGAQSGVASAGCAVAALDLPPGAELNVDGELVEAGPVEARVEPGAFELVVG
jgi:diacylglycerol kinase family enzyme